MSGLDLDAIRARLAAAKSSLEKSGTTAASPSDGQGEKKRDYNSGPLGGAWVEGTRFGGEGAVRECGEFLQSKWDSVSDAEPPTCGLLAGPGCEKAGGPPDRLGPLEELEAATNKDLDAPKASALHCAFGMLFWVHQHVITFKPDLNVAAAGQQKTSPAEELFMNMLKALNLIQQICRDVRNLQFSRYGKERCGLSDASSFSRSTAEETRKHAAALKTYLNDKMADSIGLSTGGG